MIGLLLFALSLSGFLLCTKNRTQIGFPITLLCFILFYCVDLGITSLIVYAMLYIFLVDMALICYLGFLCRDDKRKV